MPFGGVRVELPIDYRANASYDAGPWAAYTELGTGLQGRSFGAGGEVRLGDIDLRAAAVYSRELWSPAGGIGVDLVGPLAVDLAVYANSANVARRRDPALAISLRFNR